MKAINRRLRKLDESHTVQRTKDGLNPADVLRETRCRRLAKETGRPYEELLREREMKSQAFWASYDGDRSIAGVLRYCRALAHSKTVGNTGVCQGFSKRLERLAVPSPAPKIPNDNAEDFKQGAKVAEASE